MSRAPQTAASDPRASAFVSANAGSGKTRTLVDRVARLLLAGARPEAILCVTYTKAAAAEMQSRLFDQLGKWAVMPDPVLIEELAAIEESGRDLSDARALFARALETPGGLKIQTLHGFCEKLLRRFPLEAGVSPGFAVLEEDEARAISAEARAAVAGMALRRDNERLAEAYAHLSIQLDWDSFNRLLLEIEARRGELADYVDACAPRGVEADVWRRCGFSEPSSPETIERAAMDRIRWGAWSRAAEALAAAGGVTYPERGNAMRAVKPDSPFDEVAAILLTKDGAPRKSIGPKSLPRAALDFLEAEQRRAAETRAEVLAATLARDTTHVLVLAAAYIGRYEYAKAARGGLDFDDLTTLTLRLLTEKADAAWVLYKLDGGLDHILLDEGQDTAPHQWEILRALSGEFFSGQAGGSARRTLFAVADEKQSIFSFQGAAPERFSVEKQAFSSMARRARERFEAPSLLDNWRSRPEILTFVDEVFRNRTAAAGLRASGEIGIEAFPLRHVARRETGGCVELWPMEAPDEVEADADPWAPVDSRPGRSAGQKLAARLARAVRAMVEGRLSVADRRTGAPRPCAWGDVLILVRRRNALFHEIIRALKRDGIPVGEADRMPLAEHGVFEDLLALARFVLFTSDDLSLACLLRSPFCDVSEESLFELAYRREGSLWRALRGRACERSEWSTAAAFLAWARDEAATATPFDVFSRVLSRLDGGGLSMRQRIATRMGAEAENAVQAFLDQALALESRGVRDLETFAARLAGSEVEVKREPSGAREGSGGEVRVMTVHGAKGLEAPVVILPDTTAKVTDQGVGLFRTADGAFLWAPRSGEDCPPSAEARAQRLAAVEAESLRLLYVALTRARDRLIVCGVETQTHRLETSWYDFVQRAFEGLEARSFPLPGGGEGRRFGPDPRPAEALEPGGPRAEPDPPAWATRPFTPSEPSLRLASPSALGEDDRTPAPSPLATAGGLGRYRRGEIIHRLLEILPEVAPAERAAAARRSLAREVGLGEAQREEMAAAALAVLGDARFAEVFGPGSRAEVALAGRVAIGSRSLAVSGRVDRLVAAPDRVLVVDFKTNRPAPARVEDASPQYILQMALYAAVLAQAFPERQIEAALVWTDGPKLMPIPENLLSASLSALAAPA